MKFKNILILLAVTFLAVFVLAGCPDTNKTEPKPEPEAPEDIDLPEEVITEDPLVFELPAPALTNDSVLAPGTGLEIPKWEVSENALTGLSEVSFSGGKTNINERLLKSVAHRGFFSDKTIKNLIVFVENGVSSELIDESEKTYGELVMNNFAASNKVSVLNADKKVPDAFAAATAFFSGVKTKNGNLGLDKSGSSVSSFIDNIIKNDKNPATRGIISNGDLADPFISGMYYHSKDLSNKSSIYETLFMPCDSPDIFIAGKGSFDSIFSDGSSYKTNEVYKARRYLSHDFTDTVDAMTNTRLFQLANHDDAEVVPRKIVSQLSGNYGRYDTTGKDNPNFQELVALGLSMLDRKNPYKSYDMGICLVVNDTAAEEYIRAGNKEAALKQIQNFDEGVAVACRFAFDNPDTLIVVTSGYVVDTNGITKEAAPVFAMGPQSKNIRNKGNFTLAGLGKFLCSLE